MKKGTQIRAITGILAISFLTLAIGATSGALPGIGAAFPGVKTSTVTLIATLPSLTSIPFSLLSGKLSDRGVSQRHLGLVGLLILTASGVAPYWFTKFSWILASRAVFGMGMGLTTPVAGSMSLILFSREIAEKINGYSNSVAAVGAIILQYLGGFLCSVSWQYTFLAYLLCGVVFLICVLTLPATEKVPEARNEHPKPLGRKLMNWCILYFALTVCFYPLVTTVSSLITTAGYGTTTQGGACLSLFTAGGMVGSLFFSKLSPQRRSTILPVSTLLAACGFIVITAANSLLLVNSGAVIFGIGYGLYTPAIITFGGTSVPASRAPFAVSALMASMHLGGFFSAYLIGLVKQLLGIQYARFGFAFGCIGFAVITVIIWLGKESLRGGMMSGAKEKPDYDSTVKESV